MARKSWTSGSACIVLKCWFRHLNVSALSEYITDTGPRLVANLLKAARKEHPHIILSAPGGQLG